jgi:hypothetical protein
MAKISEWSFPVALVIAWMIAAAYTLSLTIDVSGPANVEFPPAESQPAS